MEGRVELKEFANPGEALKLPLATKLRFICAPLKTPKAKQLCHAKWPAAKRHGTVWKKHASEERVDGAIFGRVKGWLYC